MRSKESSKLPKMSDTMMAVGSGERQGFNWRRSLALSLHALREAGLLKHSVVVLIAPKVPLTSILSRGGERRHMRGGCRAFMPMGAPQAHAVLLRKFPSPVSLRGAKRRSNLAMIGR